MQCPNCHVDLTLSERQGVEIDYCPRCRGVWLDRGELDKIVERSDAYDRDDDDRDRDRERHREVFRGQPPHYQKKKSFWHELFD
jgi:Zn-finger nucleic acid-binding protein